LALENARLFSETQRLYKESEQRAAELAVINSVQQAAGVVEISTYSRYSRPSATRSAASSTWRDTSIRIVTGRRDGALRLTPLARHAPAGSLDRDPGKGVLAHILATGETLVFIENGRAMRRNTARGCFRALNTP
jgi:hypothetical protein